ncbi:hypothetical protein ACH95_07985 [Bacillus glycinifermentans]|uniref:hypothetical protein n=2 Tax=Bacillus TaxID=1386 RepID=UPI000653F3BB|nr:hypothetical protein [Bacillus glycinifermentans]KMM61064.1 hypothetical protein ACH95_07985 [Bacillus glycinifermentans]MEC0495918.1 hypothetical protein [Bacillus glycinifermentans]MEC0542587.1 hypothetical protein [Bacillus glycinifermentans]
MENARHSRPSAEAWQLKMNGSRCWVAADFFVSRNALLCASAQESPGGLPVIDEKTRSVHGPPAEAYS